jgi:hypothetical protein
VGKPCGARESEVIFKMLCQSPFPEGFFILNLGVFLCKRFFGKAADFFSNTYIENMHRNSPLATKISYVFAFGLSTVPG